MKAVDLIGQKYGRLTVLKRAEKKNGNRHARWVCECDCGNVVVVSSDKLRNGDTRSCGCYKIEKATERISNYNAEEHENPNLIHGMSGTRLYWAYFHMLERCYNENINNYKNYGGRGITVCNEWRKSPKAFIEWALLNGYGDDLTIDRIDVSGNYEPLNCRWVDMKTQANNKTTNVFVELNGDRITLSQLADKYGIGRGTIWWRYKSGWTPEKMTIPVRRKEK